MERRAPRHLPLLEMLRERSGGNIEAVARYDPPFVERVVDVVAQGHEIFGTLEGGKLEAADSVDQLERRAEPPLEIGPEIPQR